MQRPRSYLEAMEAGSYYDVLEASDTLVGGTFNPNVDVSGDNKTTIAKSASVSNIELGVGETDRIDRERPSSCGSYKFTDGVNDDAQPKSVHIEIHRDEDGGRGSQHSASSDSLDVERDLHIYSENDNAVEVGSNELKENKHSEQETGNIKPVDQLINEIYNNCVEYISTEENIERKSSLQFVTDITYDINSDSVEKCVERSTLDSEHVKVEVTEDQTEVEIRKRERPPSHRRESTRNGYFSDNFTRDEDSDDSQGYNSDDNILEYDGQGIEVDDRGQRNSLIIPTNAVSEENSVLTIHYTGRNSSRKFRRTPENGGFRARRSKRVIFKNGETNIPLIQHVSGRLGRLMKDIVTTLIECRWRWMIFLVSVVHFILWLVFALFFFLASYANGDLSDNPPAVPCIDNGKTFTGIFTFSVETQVSIGYGEKSPTEECPETIFIMVMEVVAGYALLGAMVGLVYAKIMRPPKKLGGVGFSRRAVVCMRDGRLCLVVRVWDAQQKHAVGTRASGWLIRHGGPTSTPLTLSPESPLVMWPTTLEHVIDEHSPLFDTSAKDLIDQRFEVVVSLTGSSRITGSMTQSRTSYLPQDILWGQRFQNILSYDHDKCSYVVDHKSLNKVVLVDTPLCSARLLKQLTEQGPSSPMFHSSPSSPPSTLTSPGWSFRKQFKPIISRTASAN